VKHGLIYLQGLTPDWRTVWHAGFQPNQIERIGLKPSSQYDHWVPYWIKTPPIHVLSPSNHEKHHPWSVRTTLDGISKRTRNRKPAKW
jgi:hypothetical protein